MHQTSNNVRRFKNKIENKYDQINCVKYVKMEMKDQYAKLANYPTTSSQSSSLTMQRLWKLSHYLEVL